MNELSNLRLRLQAVDEIAKILGFISERPDKEWKQGPDNLWKIGDNNFLLIECKNNVNIERNEIHKEETGQMNNAIAWFNRVYNEAPVKNIIVIATKNVANAAGFNSPVSVMRENKSRLLTDNIKKFYLEFKRLNFDDLSEGSIQELLNLYKLTSTDFLNDTYSEQPRIR